jgi:hypothetical protein
MPTIADLNDAFRRAIPNGRCFITRGVMATCKDNLLTLLQQVRDFNAFTPDNDPYGEHDFGTIIIGNQKLLWKIDYYSGLDLETGAENPGSSNTVRVLTIMLAEEW